MTTLNKNGRVTADSAIFRLELLFYLKAFLVRLSRHPDCVRSRPNLQFFLDMH